MLFPLCVWVGAGLASSGALQGLWAWGGVPVRRDLLSLSAPTLCCPTWSSCSEPSS